MSNHHLIREKIDLICNDFEAAWKAGEKSDIGYFLDQMETAYRDQLAHALLQVEVELRINAGEDILPENYSEYGDDVVSIVRELAQTSKTLFATQIRDTNVSPGVPQLAGLVSPGQTIGPYHLVKTIGQGGMGTVWEAEQMQPIRRSVALKVIRADIASKKIIARFEAERQALAMMDHPCIAKVFDGGTTEAGNPYFVMELVDGIPITKYCDEHKLSITDRLLLFVKVCEAIQHAHQKGIIHRDLKPSNILVATMDDKPAPKIIDFGLAKALQQAPKLTDKTLESEYGNIMGTLQYMSPEQAEANWLDVDTRTDIYAMGVILYELVTGSTPLAKQTLSGLSLIQALVTIREKETPRPSNRLSLMGDEAEHVGSQRMISVGRLQHMLRGDLDWVVMQALEKDRTRRYQTANDFSADIMRFVRSEAVAARPPSLSYRTRKFVRKHRLACFATATIFALLIAGISTTLWQRNKALANAEEARKARELAEAFADSEATARFKAELAREEALRGRHLSDVSLYVNWINRAQSEWQEGGGLVALAALNSCRKELRHWEYDYLSAMFRSQVIATAQGHQDEVTAATFSPDGLRVATAAADKTIRIWNAQTGVELLSWNAHAPSALCVAFSPDGKRLASGGVDNRVKLWNPQDGSLIREFKGHQREVRSVAFNADGSRMVTGSGDRSSIVWDVESGENLLRQKNHSKLIFNVAFSPDGTTVASGSADKFIKLWNANTGEEQLQIPLRVEVRCVAFSPDGKQIIGGGVDGVLQTWDSQNGEELLRLRGHSEVVVSVEFNSMQTKIVSGGLDHSIRIWDAQDGRELQTIQGHVKGVRDVSFSPDGHTIVSGSIDQSVRIWDSNRKDISRIFATHGGTVECVAFSPDGRRLASGSSDKTVQIRSLDNRDDLVTLTGHEKDVYCVEFSPDGSRIVSGGLDRTLRIWNAHTGQLIKTLTGHQEKVRCVSYSPDGKWILSGGDDQTIRIWDAISGEEVESLNAAEIVLCIEFSNDGSKFLSGGAHPRQFVRLWDFASRKPLREFSGHRREIRGVCFSPDGSTFASASGDNTVRVWNLQTGESLQTLKGHSALVYDVTYSSDGKRIVSGSVDKTVRVWDPLTGQETISLNQHFEEVMAVAFDPNGIYIASGSQDRTVRLYGQRRSNDVPAN